MTAAAATLARTDAAARAVDATKVYGSGDTAVVALDEVSVEFPTGRFTAIMGPSGSGKSTLMHCLAGLDSLTAGQVFIGDVELGTLSDKELTLLRRDRIGFVFQAFNLVPTLTALENITLPLTLAGAEARRRWLDEVVDTVGLGDRLNHRPASCRAASSSGSRWPGRWPAGPGSSSPTSPPATSTPAPAARSSASCAGRSTSWARPSSWSPTTRWRPRTPTGRCSWPTAGSSTSSTTRRRRRSSTASRQLGD